MKYAYFPGCKIPHHLPEYGSSVLAVCDALGIELVSLDFNCCGWPVRHENELASVYSATRNLALAAQTGLPIFTPCKCCFGNLKHAQFRLAEDERLADETNRLLAEEGLALSDKTEVFHLLTVLDEHVGVKAVKAKVTSPLDMKIACHYGCHALRPGYVTGFDDPLAPTVFERVVEALGAEPVVWDLRLECCGQPLRGKDEKISDALMRKKLEDATSSGADAIATACTYCQLQFDKERKAGMGKLPSVLLTQMIASALGLSNDVAG